MACTTDFIYKSLPKCQVDSKPGLKRRVYYVRRDDIVFWGEIDKAHGDAAFRVRNAVVYSGAGGFILAADVKWNYIDCIENKSALEIESQGTKEHPFFANKITLHLDNIDLNVSYLMRKFVADDFVFLVQDRNNRWRILGHPDLPTTIKVKGTSGDSYNSDHGATFEIEAIDYAPAPFVVSDFNTTDGQIARKDISPV